MTGAHARSDMLSSGPFCSVASLDMSPCVGLLADEALPKLKPDAIDVALRRGRDAGASEAVGFSACEDVVQALTVGWMGLRGLDVRLLYSQFHTRPPGTSARKLSELSACGARACCLAGRRRHLRPLRPRRYLSFFLCRTTMKLQLLAQRIALGAHTRGASLRPLSRSWRKSPDILPQGRRRRQRPATEALRPPRSSTTYRALHRLHSFAFLNILTPCLAGWHHGRRYESAAPARLGSWEGSVSKGGGAGNIAVRQAGFKDGLEGFFVESIVMRLPSFPL